MKYVYAFSAGLLSSSLLAVAQPVAAQAPPRVVPPGLVRFVAQHSGKCLEATGDPGQMVAATQHTCDTTSRQHWSLKPVADGYQIVSAIDSRLCLNLRVATAAQGARIWRSSCSATGTDGEIWRPEAAGDAYTLTAVHSGKCMNVSQASTADGAAIIQWTCVGSPNETWTTQPATSPPPAPGPPVTGVVSDLGSRAPSVPTVGSFVAPVAGTLYLKCVGGSAGAISQFGIGASPSTFVSYLSALPRACPTTEVAAESVRAGQTVPFGIQTWWSGQSYWAFSTSTDPGSLVSFTDVNNSLGWGGSVIQTMGTNVWVLHLNDAAHYTLGSEEANNILIQIRLQPSGSPGPMGPSGPGVVSVPGPPPPPPGFTPTESDLSPIRDALRSAVSALQRAANQSCPVQKTIADINVAISDLNGAVTFLNRYPDAAGPTVPSAVRPNFTPPHGPHRSAT